MNNTEFQIKNIKIPLSSLGIAALFFIVRVLLLVFGKETLVDYNIFDYAIMIIALLIILIDLIDLYRMNNGMLKVVAEDEGIRIYSYMLLSRYLKYTDIKGAQLREKDIELLMADTKKKYISGPTNSDLIRLMKILRDNCK